MQQAPWPGHDRVRERIEALSQYVRNLVPLARFGVIAYRDYQDPDFVTQISQPVLMCSRRELS